MPTKDLLTLRDAQVTWMSNNRTTVVMAFKIPWPRCSDTTMKAFDNRHATFCVASTRFKEAQQRLLFLIDSEDPVRSLTLESLRRRIAPTTEETLWTSYLSLRKALGHLAPQPQIAQFTKILKMRSVRYPTAYALPMTLEHIHLLNEMKDDRKAHYFIALINIAWICGQRLPDMIRLHPRDLTYSEASAELVITVRRSKVMAKKWPHCLFLPRNCWYVEAIVNLAQKLTNSYTTPDVPFLFTIADAEQERETVSHFCATLLHTVDPNLEVRSVRRGGLQRMAALGWELPHIRLFSQHADDMMLQRYLAWGLVSQHQKGLMLSVVNSMTDPSDLQQ